MANLIDTSEYQFSDIKIALSNGTYFTRLQGVRVTSNIEKSVIHGMGHKPNAIKRGRMTYGGFLRITQSNYLLLKAFMGGDVLLSKAFDMYIVYSKPIGVNFIDDAGNIGRIYSKVVKGVEFTSFDEGIDIDQTYMVINLPFIASNVRDLVSELGLDKLKF